MYFIVTYIRRGILLEFQIVLIVNRSICLKKIKRLFLTKLTLAR